MVLHGQGVAQHRGEEAWLQNGSLSERACQGWERPHQGSQLCLAAQVLGAACGAWAKLSWSEVL